MAPRARQRLFGFAERLSQRERLFKRGIMLTTAVVLIAILRVFPWGRYLEASIETRTAGLARRALGVTGSRAEIAEQWKNYREFGIETARRQVEEFYAGSDPAFQKLLRYAGMDPEHGLIRWGNYDWTLLLSSKVFEADDRGRSYRLRPNVRSIWLRHLNYRAGPIAFYLVPDGPGLAEAIDGTTAVPHLPSRQTTNSWGLRGPEPEPGAPLRVMVLGDSYMEGMFIGDDETPPECLRRSLENAWGEHVSVLNTGVMGYSPEQYYHTLTAFADRFRPHCVVVSVFANDGGSEFNAVSAGAGDWLEAEYWLDEILAHCKARHWPCLLVPAPFEYSMLGHRKPGNYPGKLADLVEIDSSRYLDPIEAFVEADLQAHVNALERGHELRGSPLFNTAIKDGHFSPQGAELWADAVCRRLLLILRQECLRNGQAHDPDFGLSGRPGREANAAETH